MKLQENSLKNYDFHNFIVQKSVRWTKLIEMYCFSVLTITMYISVSQSVMTVVYTILYLGWIDIYYENQKSILRLVNLFYKKINENQSNPLIKQQF